MKKYFKAQAKGKTGELWIYEDIGEGWFGGISAKRFADEVKALGTVNKIIVRINSAGGNVFDGVAIYNVLKKHQARVEVEIDGLAASIASVIAMAGDVVRMAGNGFLMIHDPWIMTAGTAVELREQAETMDKVRAQMLATYMRKTGGELETIDAMMSAETWMTSEEALEHGFVDETTDVLDIAAFAPVDASKFRNAPKALQEAMDRVDPKTGLTTARQAQFAHMRHVVDAIKRKNPALTAGAK